jgi:acetyl esterase/lipase
MKGKLKCVRFVERLTSLPDGVTVEKSDYVPLYAEWIRPESAEKDKVILYFHGGGPVMGNAKSRRSIVANFVKMTGYQALLFDYRPAAEHPAPSAVKDSADIYRWMLDQGYRPEDIVFVGDSAGGGIEIGTLLKLKDDRIPMPAACVAFSPSLDMTMSGESTHPYTSPLLGNLDGLPPIMIHVGNDEVLRDDSTRFGEKADAAGVNIHVKVWKGMSHCFPLLNPLFEEATEAMKQVTVFIRQNIQKDRRLAASLLYLMLYL